MDLAGIILVAVVLLGAVFVLVKRDRARKVEQPGQRRQQGGAKR